MSLNTNAALNSVLTGSNVSTNQAVNLIAALLANIEGGNSFSRVSTVNDLIELGSVNDDLVITIPSNIYIIDAKNLDLGDYTLECNGDLVIKGYSSLLNKLSTEKDGKKLITVNGGSLVVTDIELGANGTGSECIVMNGNGSESIDLVSTSFSTGSKFGTLNKLRQGYMEGGFAFNAREGFTLNDDWGTGGFTIFNTKMINCGNFVLSAGAGFKCSSIRSNINADVSLGSVVFDFDAANFNNDLAYQLAGCNANGDGAFVSDFTGSVTDAEKSTKSFFSNNQGNLKKNTFVGAKWDLNSGDDTVLSAGVEQKLAGSTVTSSLVHFDSPSDNSLRYLNSDTLTSVVQSFISLSGTRNRVITIKLYRVRGGDKTLFGENTDIIQNLSGGNDIGNFNIVGTVELTLNDVVEVWVESEVDTTVTSRTSSFLFISPK